jgi:hypothetical protein
VFTRGNDNAIWHRVWKSSTGWSGWISLGGNIVGNPVAASWGPGHVDVYARKPDGSLTHRFLNEGGPFGNDWSTWEDLGGNLASDPAPVTWGNGHMDVFVRTPSNTLAHRAFVANLGGWASWQDFGGGIQGTPAPQTEGYGHISVYARGTDNQLWQKWFTAQSGWSSWTYLGGWALSSDPLPISFAKGHVDVFARGSGNDMVHRWYQNGWSGWSSLGGGLTSQPDGQSWGNNHLEVFVRGTDNQIYQRWCCTYGWIDWVNVSAGQTLASRPEVVSFGYGHSMFFGRAFNEHVMGRGYGNWAWQGWQDLGVPPAPDYPTSRQYGGDNHSVDTAGELDVVWNLAEDEPDYDVRTALLNGLSPADRTRLEGHYPTSRRFGGSLNTESERSAVESELRAETESNKVWDGLTPADQDIMGPRVSDGTPPPSTAADYDGGPNAAERRYCRNPLKYFRCRLARDLADEALNSALNRFPDDSLHNGRGDAYRHCAWSGHMTLKWDRSQAKKFADLHEDLPNNPAREKAMDQHNNKFGRDVGDLYDGNGESEAAKENVRDYCQTVANTDNDGRLWTISEVP